MSLSHLLLLCLSSSPLLVLSTSVPSCCPDPDGVRCHPAGSFVNVTSSSSGQPMRCVCQAADGGYSLSQCKLATCFDSASGAWVQPGTRLLHPIAGANYSCLCAGFQGLVDCRPASSAASFAGCTDGVSGQAVAVGSNVRRKSGSSVLLCRCEDGGAVADCRPTACRDIDGSDKQPGQKVTTKIGTVEVECDCSEFGRMVNCLPSGCIDGVTGESVAPGDKYKASIGGVLHLCRCDGGGSGSQCVKV